MAQFEELYIKVRNRENRLYSDEQVRRLPDIDPSNSYYNEWKLRKLSAEKLINNLKLKKRPLRILEIGCGNGWFSAKLADISGAIVEGWDINETELGQARRVFSHKKNLSFANKSIIGVEGQDAKFDIIVFAASVQYFPDFNLLINKALGLLNKDGEIHILDSHFYEQHEVKAARARSDEYFGKMETPGMAQYYFHHNLNDLQHFNFKLMYNPKSVWNKLLNRRNPFYWICIRL